MAESVLFCLPTLGKHPHLTRQAHCPSSLLVDRSPPSSPLPHHACSSKPLLNGLINEAMSKLAAPLHLRAETFKRNERKLFIFHFSVFLFHLITSITAGIFLLPFIANVQYFIYIYELKRLLWTTLKTQSSFIIDRTSLEMGSEF